MKKHTFYYIALSALAMLTGCSEEDGFGLKPIDGNRSLTATIEQNNLSRTAVSEEGQVSWTETDAIGVFGTASQNIRFAYQSSTGNGSSATFRGDFPEEEPMEQAYYPYQEEATLSGNSLTLNLPSEYTYTGNSNAPMLGIKNDDGTFTFKHLTGLLRITINNVPEEAERFVITSSAATDAPNIAGQATVTDITADDASLSITANGSQSITYRLGTLTEETGFRTFFVPLPIGEYPQLSVSLYAKDRTDPYFTKTVSDITVRRAVMIDMPILDAQTGAQYVLSENTTEITEDMAEHISISPDDNTTLIYESGIAEEDVPEVGDIIFAKVSENFPDGFLGKVSSIKENGDGSYTVETGVAALSEAFDELYVNETVTLEPIEQTRSRADGSISGFDIELTKEIGAVYKTESSPFYASSKANFGSRFAAYIFLDKQKKVERINLTFVNSFSMEGEIGMSGTFPSDEEKGVVKMGLGSISFKSVPMAYGIIQITPVIAPALVARAKGTAENKIGFETKILNISGAEYTNGKWNPTPNREPNGSENKSPWKFENGVNSSLTFKGELFAGFAFALEGRLYNRDDMKISVEPEAGINLEGQLEVNSDNSESLEQILSDAKLTTSVGINASFKADASLLVPGDLEAEIKLFNLKLWEREVPLLPFMKKPEATVTPKEETETTPEQAYTADMTSELQGPTLMKDMEVSYVLENEDTGEIEEVSDPIAYSGDMEGEIYEGEMPQDTTQTVEVKFDNLKEDATYKIYPVVTSPTLENIAEENKVELPERAITVSTTDPNYEREILINLYNATDGDNWKLSFETNWCSDKPLNEWYGIETNDAGNVISIDLAHFGLTGIADLRGLTHLEKVNLEYNSLTALGISGLSNLKELDCANNQLTNLDVAELTNLEHLYCESNLLTELNVSQLRNLTILICNKNNLKTLDLKNLTQLTSLSCSYNQLSNLDVTHLTKLINFSCNSNQLSNIDVSNLTQLINLSCGDNGLTTLDVSNCTKLQDLSCSIGNLTNLDVSKLTDLRTLSCTGNPIVSLDVSKCTQLRDLNCGANDELVNLNISGLTNLVKLQLAGSDTGVNGGILDVSASKNLEELKCVSSGLTQINVSGLTHLKSLECWINNLSNLDVSGLSSLVTLDCNYNQSMSSLNLTGAINLETIDCSSCNIRELDITDLQKLKTLDCANNNSLTTVYLSQYPDNFTGLYGMINPELYPEPNHKNGYQYPEFIYK